MEMTGEQVIAAPQAATWSAQRSSSAEDLRARMRVDRVDRQQ